MPGRTLPPRERELLDAADFIRRNFRRRPTLVEIAEAANLSRFHFQRLFKRRFGESPYQMVARLQIEHAKELLLQDVPGPEIARRVGFAHHSHFITRFKQVTGATPAKWRRVEAREPGKPTPKPKPKR